MRCTLFGTSRLHRPFAKRLDSKVFVNIRGGVEVIFPRVGYFHTAGEIAQAGRLVTQGSAYFRRDILPYVLRMEPPATTPLNEFDSRLRDMILTGEGDYVVDATWKGGIDCVFIEICSLSANIHVETALYVHTNPNFVKDVPYAQIYPEGFYQKFCPSFGVERKELGVDDVAEQLRRIRELFVGARIIAIGHLTSEGRSFPVRQKVNSCLRDACLMVGVEYFDVAPFVDEFGFAEVGGKEDIHHLSDAGEVAIGRALQDKAVS